MSDTVKKLTIVAFVIVAIAAFFMSGLHEFFTLENLRDQRENWQQKFQENPILFGGAFFLVYVIFTSLNIPAAALLTVAAGALFGFWIGLIIVSFASTLGATISFLATRYLLRDGIEKKFSKQLEKINQGVEKDGALYVFGLRLVPIFPFFLVNMLLALTKIKTSTFYYASQIGMFFGTAIFVNAGKQLGEISSLSDILSPMMIASFVLLGVFPIVAKYILNFLQSRKAS